MRKAAVVIVLTSLLGLSSSAWAATQTARSGSVTATFSFRGHFLHYSHERLTIAQGAVILYDQSVASKLCPTQCAPGAPEAGQSSVHVVDLEHTGRPDVLLDLFSEGAHCCSIEQIFSLDPATMTYTRTEHNFGDPGARLVDLRHDGRFEFLTADDSFAYRFTDFAASGLPIQILTFAGRHFTNVTRSYPHRIAQDAARWMRLFRGTAREHYSDSVGVAAAWAADQELLGHKRLVNRFLATQARAGHLKSALGLGGGQRFIAHLHRFLRHHGYLS